MNAERLVIVDGVRTPFCKMGTDLARLGADELGRIAVNALLTRTGLDPHRIDEVIFGCVGQPADAANVARVIALRAGIPEQVPAVTVHRNCASGCEAVTQACEKMIADLDTQITNLSTQIEDRVKRYNLTMEERVRIANRVKATDEAWDKLNIVKDGIFDAIQRGGVPSPSPGQP